MSPYGPGPGFLEGFWISLAEEMESDFELSEVEAIGVGDLKVSCEAENAILIPEMVFCLLGETVLGLRMDPLPRDYQSLSSRIH